MNSATRIWNSLRYFLAESSAATSIEYAALLGLIGAGAIGGAIVVGQRAQSGIGAASMGAQGQAGNRPSGSSSGSNSGSNSGSSSDGTNTAKDPGTITAPDGHDWSYYNGTWTFNDGVLSSSDRWSAVVTPAGYENYTVTMTVQTTELDGPNVWDVTRPVFRFQDINNYYALVPKTDGVLELAKMQDGVWRPWLAYAKTGLDPRQPHEYTVTVTGARSQVWVDGIAYMDYVDTTRIKGGGSVGVINSWSKGSMSDLNITKPGVKNGQ